MTDNKSTAADNTPYAKRLADAGYTDFYVLSLDAAIDILTEKRRQLINIIAGENIDSIRHLARTAERDIKNVANDLDLLVTNGIVEYETEANRKIPVLAHDTIVVAPLVDRSERRSREVQNDDG